MCVGGGGGGGCRLSVISLHSSWIKSQARSHGDQGQLANHEISPPCDVGPNSDHEIGGRYHDR